MDSFINALFDRQFMVTMLVALAVFATVLTLAAPLMAGDKFILYTENLLKLKSSQGEAFGPERFHETLKRAAHESAAGMLQALSAEVKRFREGSVDDEDGLVLVIERHPNNVTCLAYPEATGFPHRVEKSLFRAGVVR